MQHIILNVITGRDGRVYGSVVCYSISQGERVAHHLIEHRELARLSPEPSAREALRALWSAVAAELGPPTAAG